MNEGIELSSILTGKAERLYILDFGLFQVNDNGRVIGIPGYLIQTRDMGKILVDTGFPARYADEPQAATLADGLETFGQVLKLDRANLPEGQLGLIGLTPADVDVLVLTHGDIDHVGGIADFPQAPVYVGRDERLMERPRYFEEHQPMEWPDGVEYRLVSEDMSLCSGVALLYTPGHSPGHISLAVDTRETGPILLTCDAIARPAEMEEGFGGAWDEEQAAASARRLLTISEHLGAWVIYGHDPAQWPLLRKAPAFYG